MRRHRGLPKPWVVQPRKESGLLMMRVVKARLASRVDKALLRITSCTVSTFRAFYDGDDLIESLCNIRTDINFVMVEGQF